MTSLMLAGVSAYGVFLVFTAVVAGWQGVGPIPGGSTGRRGPRAGFDEWLRQAGLDDVDKREFVLAVVALFVIAFALAFAVFGGVVAPLVVGAFAATFPIASYRRRRITRRLKAQENWPRLIEEIRILTGSAGRSIPQALFEVGRRGPEEMRAAFDAAHREWLLSTDFVRTIDVLKHRLADATADTVGETLLIAHELGGSDLDARLGALVDDRVLDLQGRKDARARQAGARFARWFVLGVPFGMALAGGSIGNGRAAYAEPTGQMIVVVAVALVVGCWVWSGSIMRLPDDQRVFRA